LFFYCTHLIFSVQFSITYPGDYRTVKRYYESGMKGDINKLRERKTSVSSFLSD
ncbi:TPA_asm: hypothetical protein GYS95_14650, partial [Listeria monocytogenes]|nr:hypothetical protein [Listeria monocytogenes]